MGEGSEREQCCLLGSPPAFSHFHCYPGANWALLVLIPGWVVGLCTFWDPVGLSNKLSCESGSFSHCHNPHRCFQSEVWGFISPCWSPGLWGLSRSPVAPPSYLHENMGLHSLQSTASPGLPATALPALVIQPLPCRESSLPGCPSPPLLPVWMNGSSLTPWMSDFHTVWFCQFWLFFVFKFGVALVLAVEEA